MKTLFVLSVLLAGFTNSSMVQACDIKIKCSGGGNEDCEAEGEEASCGSNSQYAYCIAGETTTYICCKKSGDTYTTSARDRALAKCDSKGEVQNAFIEDLVQEIR